ncbi:hypothetical protein D3C80_2102280 [compost metagenome]
MIKPLGNSASRVTAAEPMVAAAVTFTPGSGAVVTVESEGSYSSWATLRAEPETVEGTEMDTGDDV